MWEELLFWVYEIKNDISIGRTGSGEDNNLCYFRQFCQKLLAERPDADTCLDCEPVIYRERKFDSERLGIFISVNESFIQVKVNCFFMSRLFLQFYLLPRHGNFDMFCYPECFYCLIKMLTSQIHHIRRLISLERPVNLRLVEELIIDIRDCCCCLWVLFDLRVTLDQGKLNLFGGCIIASFTIFIDSFGVCLRDGKWWIWFNLAYRGGLNTSVRVSLYFHWRPHIEIVGWRL